MISGNSLLDDITEKMTSTEYDDEKVDISLAVIGESLNLAYIAVKEVVSEDHVLCCTYEWSADGKRELLNNESRFSDDIWDRWLRRPPQMNCSPSRSIRIQRRFFLRSRSPISTKRQSGSSCRAR